MLLKLPKFGEFEFQLLLQDVHAEANQLVAKKGCVHFPFIDFKLESNIQAQAVVMDQKVSPVFWSK